MIVLRRMLRFRRRPSTPAWPAVSGLAWLIAAGAALLAGCVSIGTSDTPPMAYYVLADARPADAAAPAGATATLAVHSAGSDPLADSTAIAYSRQPGQRSLYQLAAWTERPSRRLAQLAQQRLQARGRFAAVTQLGQPVGTDWLLTVALDSMVHDISSEPGQARIALRADLIYRPGRTLVAQRVFTTAPAVAQAAPGAAVAAFAIGTADVLDQLAEWVESSVAAYRGN